MNETGTECRAGVPARRAWPGWVLGGALLLAVVAGVAHWVSETGWPPGLAPTRLHGQDDRGRIAMVGAMDRLYRELPPGAIYVSFTDMRAAEASAMGGYIYEQFMRACYVRYPYPVYVSAEARLVRHASDLVTYNALPDAAWLQAHQVVRVVRFTHDADGRAAIKVTPIPLE